VAANVSPWHVHCPTCVKKAKRRGQMKIATQWVSGFLVYGTGVFVCMQVYGIAPALVSKAMILGLSLMKSAKPVIER
jgi:hypothetical protein